MNPVILQAYKRTVDLTSFSGPVSVENLVIRLHIVQAVLSDDQQSASDKETWIEVAFRACASDAERLMLLDMTALESGPQSQLFADDGRFRATSWTGAKLVAGCLTE